MAEPATERPAERLIDAIREARLDPTSLSAGDPATLVCTIAGDPVATGDLLQRLAAINEADDVIAALRRHARHACRSLDREIARLDDFILALPFWGQSAGVAMAAAATIGIAAGTLVSGGGLALLGASLGLAGVATGLRHRLNIEKQRLRQGRDAVALLLDTLDDKAKALERSSADG